MIGKLALLISVSPTPFNVILVGHLQDIGCVSRRHSRRGWRCHQLKPYAILPRDLLILSSKCFSIPTPSLHHQRDGVGTKVSPCFSSITPTVFQLVPLLSSCPFQSILHLSFQNRSLMCHSPA